VRENWINAPREVRLIVALGVAASVVGTSLYGVGVGVDHPPAIWLRVLNSLTGVAIASWIVHKFLTRRRWAWIVLWWVSLLGLPALALAIGQGRSIVIPIVNSAFSLSALIPSVPDFGTPVGARSTGHVLERRYPLLGKHPFGRRTCAAKDPYLLP